MIRCRTIGTLSCLFIVVIIFKTVLAETISDSQVHLEFNIEGEGFHQNLHLHGLSWMNNENCHYLLKWSFPTGAYADPYQLQFFIENRTVHFVEGVNIESMARNSPEIVLYTVEKPVCREACEFYKTIPFHARYHSPSMKESSDDLSVLVNFVPPLVYSSCNVVENCFDENNTACRWEKMKSSTSLLRTQVSVPIGDLSHSVTVAVLTLFTTIVGTAFLAKEI